MISAEWSSRNTAHEHMCLLSLFSTDDVIGFLSQTTIKTTLECIAIGLVDTASASDYFKLMLCYVISPRTIEPIYPSSWNHQPYAFLYEEDQVLVLPPYGAYPGEYLDHSGKTLSRDRTTNAVFGNNPDIESLIGGNTYFSYTEMAESIAAAIELGVRSFDGLTLFCYYSSFFVALLLYAKHDSIRVVCINPCIELSVTNHTKRLSESFLFIFPSDSNYYSSPPLFLSNVFSFSIYSAISSNKLCCKWPDINISAYASL